MSIPRLPLTVARLDTGRVLMNEEPLYSFSCPVCQAELSLPLSQAGISGPCPFCLQTITAPIPTPGTAPISRAKARGGKGGKPAPVRMDSAPVPRAEAGRAGGAAASPVEEDAGARRASRLMGLIGALAAIGAGAAGVFAWQKLGGTGDSPDKPGPAEPQPAVAAAGEKPAVPPVAPQSAEVPPVPLAGATPKESGVTKEADLPQTAETGIPAEQEAGKDAAPGKDAGIAATGDKEPMPDAGAGAGAETAPPDAGEPAGKPAEPSEAAAPEPAAMAANGGTTPPAEAAPEAKPYERQVPPPNPEDPAIILREPREALLAFLNAKDWQTRLKYSLRPEEVRAEMEAYYKEQPDGAVDAKIDYLTSDYTEDTKTPMWFFNVLTESRAPIPVALEQTASGIRVDWRGFIEGYDQRLAKFCAKPAPGQGTFYVAASRAHWFGGKIADADSMACFKLYPPTADEYFLALVDTRTPFWKEKFVATGRASWEVNSRMIVTLEWAKSGDTDYLRLVDIKADSWRADARAAAPQKNQ